MRIVRAAIRSQTFGLDGHGAARGRTSRTSLLLELTGEIDRGPSGIAVVGRGEAAPLPGMSSDTFETARTALESFAARLPSEVKDTRDAFAIAADFMVSPAARFAIETALLDALAQTRSTAIADLLDPALDPGRAVDPADLEPAMVADDPEVARDGLAAGSRGPEIEVGHDLERIDASTIADRLGRALDSANLEHTVVVDDPDEARHAVAAGARCLKIKIGPGIDLERVSAIAAAAPGVALRLDANRRWPPETVVERLTALAGLGLPIEFVEEPCENAVELLDERLLHDERLPLPIALDESLAGLPRAEIERVLRSPSLGAIILKPTLLGGFAVCLELARAARAAGVRVVVTHALEGPVGFAACRELAGAVGGGPHGLAPYAIGSAELHEADASASATTHRDDASSSRLGEANGSAEPHHDPALRRDSSSSSDPAVLLARPRLDTVRSILTAFDARQPIALLHHALPQAELDRRRELVEQADLGDAAVVLFTSGSTGDGRGVVLARTAIEGAAAASAAHLGWHADDRWLVALSMAHAGGLAAVLRCHLAGKPIELLEGDWDRGRAAGLLERCTLASLVPAQLASLLEDPAWRPPPRLRAVLLGGAAASPTLLAFAAARRVPFLVTYGMTETFGQVATAHAVCAGDPAAPMVALPGVELEAGTRAAPARIAVRGGMLAIRYLDGERIAPRFETADLGFLDAAGEGNDGSLHVVGRVDDVIVTGGENVHPATIEAVLAETPGVIAACAFGVADERWGQIVGAAIAGTVDDAAVARWHAALPAHARPREIAIVGSLPMLPTGKLDRRAAARLPRAPVRY